MKKERCKRPKPAVLQIAPKVNKVAGGRVFESAALL